MMQKGNLFDRLHISPRMTGVLFWSFHLVHVFCQEFCLTNKNILQMFFLFFF